MKKNIKKHLVNNEKRCRYCGYSSQEHACYKEIAPYHSMHYEYDSMSDKKHDNKAQKSISYFHRETVQNESYYPCCDKSNHSHHENRRERKMHNPLKVCSIMVWVSILTAFAIISIWNSVAKVNAHSYDIPETIYISEKALTVDEFGRQIIIVDDVYSENK